MKSNFEQMSVPELRAYVLAHRDDIEAIRALFHHPHLKWETMPPLVTPEGLPIEENIRTGEEALRRRVEREKTGAFGKRVGRTVEEEQNNLRNDSMTTVTPEEIQQFRQQFVSYPEAIAALDTIEECDGYLEDAVTLLMMRETGREPDRGVREWLQKCRQVICQEDIKEAISSGIIAQAIEPLAIGAGFPPGTATALGILAFKLGVKKLCDSPNSPS